MRVTYLEFEAFGPFASRQFVDFAEATADGLLLIAGRTGSGKSTLLDAICFALYGRVPRYDGNPERVRSDHARADQNTEVVIEFALGNDRYRLARSPKWEKPKRGGGVREVGQTAKLWKSTSTGAWRGLASRPTDVAEQLHTILPLNVDQFLQVVLLSQGGFQKFLQADPADRQRTLRSLFHTGIFEQLEHALDAERKQAEQQLETVLARSSTLQSELTNALSADEAEFLDRHDSESLEPDAEYEARILALDDEFTVTKQRHNESRQRATEANVAFERARNVDRLWRRRAQALADLAQLETDTELITELQETLDAASRAEHVVPHIERLREAKRANNDAEEHQIQANRALGLVIVESEDAEPEVTKLSADISVDQASNTNRELETAFEQSSARIGRLQSAIEIEAGLPQLRQHLESCEAELGSVKQTQQTLAAESKELPPRIKRLRDEIVELHQAVSSAERKRDDVHEATERVKASSAADEIAMRMKAAQEAAGPATRQAADAGKKLATLTQKRIDGMAGELAETLQPNEKCPVCGASDHPQPAKNTDPVTKADMDAAQQNAKRLEHERDIAHERVNTLEKQLVELQSTTGGRSLEELRADLQQKKTVLDEILRQEEQLQVQQQQLAVLEKRTEVVHDDLEHNRQQVEQLSAQKTAIETRLSEHSERVASARGLWPSVSDRLNFFNKFRAAILELQEAIRETHETTKLATVAQSDVTEALSKYGFSNTASAQQAVLPDTEKTALESRLQKYTQQRHVAEAILAEPEMADLPVDNADVDAAEQEKILAQEHADELRLREHSLGEKLLVRKRQFERLSNMLVSHETEQQRVYELRQLTEAVKGNEPNTKRMRLEAYVLAGRLEAIVDAANQRFATISADRYLLEHDDSRQSRNKQSGLGLRVYDSYTGKSRSTASLSGGETFLAALSLALGLADVVTAEVGGIDLDTLFIDEGFGSLDPEALEQALTVLDSLREGGRAIAAISHVSEMHERIPNQLQVVSSAYGPSNLSGAGVQTEPRQAKDAV